MFEGNEVELLARLALAALLGLIIGFEREHAGHTAGVRTHLLVAVGAALFTELSFVGFPTDEVSRADTSRVAAQVVTGIGFLGAGAILRYGRVVRGLTTAASIWAVAALGMAAGTGQYELAAGGTLIILVALAPLRSIVRSVFGGQGAPMELRVRLGPGADIGTLTAALAERAVAIRSVRRERDEAMIELTLPRRVTTDELVVMCAELDHVELLDLAEDDD
jgi:putative Mg2+ transporter-C (MgtC) family protein